MEELAAEGSIDALLDLTTHEVTDELFGGIHAGDNQRLVAGTQSGIHRMVVPGVVDVITLGEPHTVPAAYRGQPSVPHNPHITLVRMNAEQMLRLAAEMAQRLNRSPGPVAVVIPKGGLSFYNRRGLHFYDEGADSAFLEPLKAALRADITIYELEPHINDPEFAREIVPLFAALLEKAQGGRVRTAERRDDPSAGHPDAGHPPRPILPTSPLIPPLLRSAAQDRK